MTEKEFVKWITDSPGVCKWGYKKLSDLSGLPKEKVIKLVKPYRQVYNISKKDDNIEQPSNTKKKIGINRLFFDIETSPNIVFSWNVGGKISIDYNNIIQERAIICICWKWEDSNTVHSLSWNKGDDKDLIKQFLKVIEEADEVIGHNGDNYDLKWFRTRCIYHGIKALPEFKSIDTLKISRKQFRFNSNRLDYIGKFLGFGGKMDTGGFALWKDIVLNNNTTSLNKMIEYCKKDVILLENVYHKVQGYTTPKTNIAVLQNDNKKGCPHCGSSNCYTKAYRYSSTGMKKVQLQCKDCYKYYMISDKIYNS